MNNIEDSVRTARPYTRTNPTPTLAQEDHRSPNSKDWDREMEIFRERWSVASRGRWHGSRGGSRLLATMGRGCGSRPRATGGGFGSWRRAVTTGKGDELLGRAKAVSCNSSRLRAMGQGCGSRRRAMTTGGGSELLGRVKLVAPSDGRRWWHWQAVGDERRRGMIPDIQLSAYRWYSIGY